jgi:hypothetical protein
VAQDLSSKKNSLEIRGSSRRDDALRLTTTYYKSNAEGNFQLERPGAFVEAAEAAACLSRGP